jgi:hypothetical protein
MTNVTLPNFVENIEKGFIVVGETLYCANNILNIQKTIDDKCLEKVIKNMPSPKQATEFIEKYNIFLALNK